MTKRSVKRIPAPNRGKRSGYRPPVCIFCTAPPDSLEHILPVWTQEIIPPLPEATFSEYGRADGHYIAEDLTESLVSNRERGFDVAHLRVGVVSTDCNTGWMSQLEDAAKPVLSSLIRGEPRLLSARDQMTISTWMTLRAMVSEMLWPDRACTTQPDRHQFRAQQQPFQNSKVWLAYYPGDRNAKAVHRYATAHTATKGAPRQVVAHCITLRIGALVAIYLYSVVPALNTFYFEPPLAAFVSRIFPLPVDRLDWPEAVNPIPDVQIFNGVRKAFKEANEAAQQAALAGVRRRRT